MRKLIIKASLLILFIPLILTLGGCHGWIGIWGRVYEWIDAPKGSHSFIYLYILEDWRDYEIVLNELEECIPEESNISPLNHAQLTVYPKGLEADESYYTATSNISGEFYLSKPIDGGKYPIKVKIGRIGYIGIDY